MIQERETDMKQLKKWMLVLMCAGTMMSVTACGSDKNAKDNEATQDQDHTGKDQDRDMADDEDSKDVYKRQVSVL